MGIKPVNNEISKLTKLAIIFACISIGVLLFIGYKFIKKIKPTFFSSMLNQIENKYEESSNQNKVKDKHEYEKNKDKKEDEKELIKDRIDISCLLKDDSNKQHITIVPKIKKYKVGNLKKVNKKYTQINK